MKFFFIKVFYISTLITFSQKAIAQKADTTSTKNKQDGYNIKYRQPLDSLMMLGLSFMADNTLFHLPTIHGGKSFDILPNMAPPLKLSFRYKSLGLSVSGLRFLLYGTGYKSFNIDWTPTKNLSFYYTEVLKIIALIHLKIIPNISSTLKMKMLVSQT